MTRKALRLEYALISYNVMEGLVAVVFGYRAESIALVGFGLDSMIEVAAASVLIWRLRQKGPVEEETSREKRALFFVGITFFLLAAFIFYEAAGTLLRNQPPRTSWIGIWLAVASLGTMFVLGWLKKRIALQMGSRALEADAMETFVCGYLSFTLLLGLGLNAWIGWWWADPAAALAMLYFIVKEGWESLEAAREN